MLYTLIWFGYIARLFQWGGGGYFTRSNNVYLPSLGLDEGGGGVRSVSTLCDSLIRYRQLLCTYTYNTRGRILGQNPDKSLESFPPCYSQLPLLQLCLEISISLNSRNLLQFLYRGKTENLIENYTLLPMV